VKVRIPIPAEIVVPLAVAGWLLIAVAVAYFSYQRIKSEGRTGWFGFVGAALISPLVIAFALLVGKQGGQGEWYYTNVGMLAVVGFACIACLFKASRIRAARWISRFTAAGILLKMIVEPPLLVVSGGDGFRVMPAAISHPMNLVLIALIVGFSILGSVFWERHSRIASRRSGLGRRHSAADRTR